MIEQQPDPIVPTEHKYQQFEPEDKSRYAGFGLPLPQDRSKFWMLGGAIFLGIMLVYGHEKSTEARAARLAFEGQRDMNKTGREQAWMQGYQAGCNATAESLLIAIQQGMTTNAQTFVNSNVLWRFNLERPK